MPSHCKLCPRICGANRAADEQGVCGGGAIVRIARAAPHFWEEPCISGNKGSGAVFFTGCPLRCCFCQNDVISTGNFGKEITTGRLAEIFLDLQDQGVHNLNLVSPSHWTPWIIEALEYARPHLKLPVIWNSSGYEQVETLRLLEGLVDIYLPDFKFYSTALSMRYAQAADYFAVASRALQEMHRQTGAVQIGEDGLMQRGVLVRYLALPKAREDGEQLLLWLANAFPTGEVMISLMSQYTPNGQVDRFPELTRPVSSYEYRKLLELAQKCELAGFMQDKSAAQQAYTPPFDLTGVL